MKNAVVLNGQQSNQKQNRQRAPGRFAHARKAIVLLEGEQSNGVMPVFLAPLGGSGQVCGPTDDPKTRDNLIY